MTSNNVASLQDYLTSSGEELTRHYNMLDNIKKTNSLKETKDKKIWKHKWWSLLFIKSNYLLLKHEDI